jgi:hypothetical protein
LVLRPALSRDRSRLTVAAVAIIALGGCRFAAVREPPPFELESASAVVRAGNELEAKELFDDLSIVYRAGLDLPDTVDKPVELWGVDRLEYPVAYAASYRNTGPLGRDRIEFLLTTPVEQRQHVLAHELTHYRLGASWDALPAIVEEGLATHVANLASPKYGATYKAWSLVFLSRVFLGELRFPVEAEMGTVELTIRLHLDSTSFPSVRAAIEMESDALPSIDDSEVKEYLYHLGFLYAREIGAARLHGLCRRARTEGRATVPADWIFEAAEFFPGDRSAWENALENLREDTPAEQLLEIFLRGVHTEGSETRLALR